MNVSWKTGKSGDWASGSKWSGGTVPGAADAVSITAAGAYTVTISSAVAAGSLDIGGAGVVLRELAGGSLAVSNSGGIAVHDGAALILGSDNANLGGYVSMRSGSLEVGSAGALGTTSLNLFGGSAARWTVSSTLGNAVGFYKSLGGSAPDEVALAVAHGATLAIASAAKIGVDTDIVLGNATDNGTIVLASDAGKITKDHMLEIAGGTLALGSKQAAGFFHHDGGKSLALAIDNGTKFDLAGYAVELDKLIGTGGDIINSSKKAVALIIDDTNAAEIATSFSGALQIELRVPNQAVHLTGSMLLEGKGGLVVDQGTAAQFDSQFGIGAKGYLVFSGASLRLADFLIDSSVSALNSTLSLYGSGSINHGISFGSTGYLDINSNSTIHISGDISGGHFQQRGTGTVYLSGVNTLTGGFVDKGTLVISLGASLGTGNTTFNSGSTLETLNTTTISSRIVLLTTTVAAQHATTLTLSGDVQIAYGDTAGFGKAGFDGTIIYSPNSDSDIDGEVAVHAGTFVVGNSRATLLIAGSDFLQVDAGGTLDLHGQYVSVQELIGTGTVVNNGMNHDSLSIGSGDFAGTITGGIAVEATGAITLSGTGSFDALYIDDGASATLNGTASERIYMFDGDATLILGAASNLTGKINDSPAATRSGWRRCTIRRRQASASSRRPRS